MKKNDNKAAYEGDAFDGPDELEVVKSVKKADDEAAATEAKLKLTYQKVITI